MEAPLLRFMQALRDSGVRLSVAESIDAFRTVAVTGFADREALKDALALVLAKTQPEKALFAECFDLFFARDGLDFSGAGSRRRHRRDPIPAWPHAARRGWRRARC